MFCTEDLAQNPKAPETTQLFASKYYTLNYVKTTSSYTQRPGFLAPFYYGNYYNIVVYLSWQISKV